MKKVDQLRVKALKNKVTFNDLPSPGVGFRGFVIDTNFIRLIERFGGQNGLKKAEDGLFKIGIINIDNREFFIAY